MKFEHLLAALYVMGLFLLVLCICMFAPLDRSYREEHVRVEPIARSFDVRCPRCNSLVHVVTDNTGAIGEVASKPE
jgi:hypothetical protein